MGKIRRIAFILTLVVAFCFFLFSLIHAAPDDPVTEGWASSNLNNKIKATSIPIWKITKNGTGKSVRWVNHAPNARFAIYDSGTPSDATDDLVIDKETGLVWARDANLSGSSMMWGTAIEYCCKYVKLGNRKGWRLPTREELSSLVDPSKSDPSLPKGHPFINVQNRDYWSSTTYEDDSSYAWEVYMRNGCAYDDPKSRENYVWPVRGGNGYGSGNW